MHDHNHDHRAPQVLVMSDDQWPRILFSLVVRQIFIAKLSPQLRFSKICVAITFFICCTGLLRRVNLALGSNPPVTTVTMAHVSTKEPYRGVFDCLSRILKEEGLRGFYRGGAPAMIIRDIPGYAMYFVPYAILCDLFKSSVTGEPNALGYIMAGGLAGVISWGFAHPMDTLKSR